MHHRSVQGQQGSKDANHVVPSGDVDDNDNGNDNVTKQRKRKKGKRRRHSKQRALQRLLSCGMIAMVFVLAVALVRRQGSSSNSSNSNNSNNNNKPKFEVYTPNAPSCNEPLDSDDDVSFTLVTQLSEDRLWMMEHHCQRYHQAMSIAIYTNRTHQEVADDLKAMNCPVFVVSGDNDGDNDDSSTITLSVLDATLMGLPSTDYPVNHLRNLAISKVKTSHIIYIDVDFWTSDRLYETLMANGNIRDALAKDPRQALVIPAFQLNRQCREWKDCRDANLPHMPYNLQELSQMLNKKRGNIFDPTNRGGHGSTLYQQWTKQEPGSLLPIPCLQSNRYEPFVVIRKCHELPPFQKEFSGYGKNKMTWMMQLIRNGYSLSQVGGVYLCHYPHLDSNSRQHWNEAPKQLQVGEQQQVRKPKASDGNLNLHEFKRGQVDKLFLEFRDWMLQEVPDRSLLHHCETAQDDDSKLWIDRT
jgi:hypothetical protein